MTCIIYCNEVRNGIKTHYMAGDLTYSSGYNVRMTQTKLFETDRFIVGMAGSIGLKAVIQLMDVYFSEAPEEILEVDYLNFYNDNHEIISRAFCEENGEWECIVVDKLNSGKPFNINMNAQGMSVEELECRAYSFGIPGEADVLVDIMLDTQVGVTEEGFREIYKRLHKRVPMLSEEFTMKCWVEG